MRNRYPGRMIDVLNRGIGGQEAPEELTRFQDDVIAEDAALVIWQVGTNAIYRSLYEPAVVAGIVATGLSWLKGLGPLRPDVILMDLQYAPALFEDDKGNQDPNKAEKTREMEWRLADVAQQAEVNLFQRFKLMEQWVKDGSRDSDKSPQTTVNSSDLVPTRPKLSAIWIVTLWRPRGSSASSTVTPDTVGLACASIRLVMSMPREPYLTRRLFTTIVALLAG